MPGELSSQLLGLNRLFGVEEAGGLDAVLQERSWKWDKLTGAAGHMVPWKDVVCCSLLEKNTFFSFLGGIWLWSPAGEQTSWVIFI